jgi:hypothetical protein
MARVERVEAARGAYNPSKPVTDLVELIKGQDLSIFFHFVISFYFGK